jgi:L-seryl-tRNA(Ser) seleniumtransferase
MDMLNIELRGVVKRTMKQYVRMLPPVHELQKDKRFDLLLNDYNLSRRKLTIFVQEEINDIRTALLNGKWKGPIPKGDDFFTFLFKQAERKCKDLSRSVLKRVINATGTVLHTNLGRARLSDEAIKHVIETASNYSNLEYNLNKAKRGSRHDIIEQVVRTVTGAEAAMVVNNNAAAVYLILRALAKEKEVIVSRGELVEIGGSFRVSSIMEESGAHLKEVGTTNKTHLFDYEHAITDETSMIMKVHTSNFKTVGFTDSVHTTDLVKLANEQNVLYYEDLGSGALFDFQAHGIGDEPLVRDVLSNGAHLVSFSGDKLLGGPQAGIIAGNKALIDQLKKHQLARVLRVDKMTLAALETTLKAYSYEDEEHIKQIPTVHDILLTKEEVKQKAMRFCDYVNDEEIDFVEETSQVGGGTMPDVFLDTYTVVLKSQSDSAQAILDKLRANNPPIVARIKGESVLLDFRTIQNEEIEIVAKAVRTIFA